MEKITRYIPIICFVAYLAKVTILSAQWTDAPIILTLGAFSVFMELNYQFSRLKELEEKVTVFKAEIKELQDIKSYLSSMKLSQRR